MKAAVVLTIVMALTGCDFARKADSRISQTLDQTSITRGVEAVADAVAVQCATLDGIIVRLAIDSVARLTGTSRAIERLRSERRRVCREAEATRVRILEEGGLPDGTTSAP